MRTFCLIKYFIYFFAFVIFGFACQQKKQEISAKESNSQIVNTLMAKGNGYYAIGNLDSAVAVLLRAMPIANELPKKDKYAEINRRLGEYYRATHNYAEAKNHLRLAINLAKKYEFKTILAKSYGRRAAVANEENDFDSAYFYLQQTLAISKDTNLLIGTYNELGQIFTSEQNKI
jgi:tetratricopeptide (TPR) repeat protein